MNASALLAKLTPFGNRTQLVVENQTTKDIIKNIIDAHKKYQLDYDRIASDFWKGSVRSTCEYLFSFLKNNVQYSIEPDTRQSVKSPAAIISTGKYKTGGNDCKHYSLFQAGVLDALKRKGHKIEWCYRFANYKLFSTTPHHVFIVVKINGKEYWCDPVLDYWNQKKGYINAIDKKMSLYSISGIDCSYGCTSYGQPSLVGKVSRSVKRAKRRSGENCKGRTGAKIALSVPRRAFLALVRLNVKKYALKLYKSLNDPKKRPALLAKWCNLGGNAALLESTVNKAVNKYKRKHPGQSIGVAIPALITSATPVIIALLKFMGGKSDEIEEYQPEQEQPEESTESSGETIKGIDPYYLYGAIGLGAIYLMTRKKKLF